MIYGCRLQGTYMLNLLFSFFSLTPPPPPLAWLKDSFFSPAPCSSSRWHWVMEGPETKQCCFKWAERHLWAAMMTGDQTKTNELPVILHQQFSFLDIISHVCLSVVFFFFGVSDMDGTAVGIWGPPQQLHHPQGTASAQISQLKQVVEQNCVFKWFEQADGNHFSSVLGLEMDLLVSYWLKRAA